jgi:hypothetical protein
MESFMNTEPHWFTLDEEIQADDLIGPIDRQLVDGNFTKESLQPHIDALDNFFKKKYEEVQRISQVAAEARRAKKDVRSVVIKQDA